MIKHEDLFNEYQHILAWIDRRSKPDVARLYQEKPDYWKHAKEIAFTFYENLRYKCDDGIPDHRDSFIYDKALVKDIPPYEDKFPAIGILKYRGEQYTIYNDDYGMQYFIVIDDRSIAVDSFGGDVDWWYELDRIIDNIKF